MYLQGICVKEDAFVCSSRRADGVTLCAEVFIFLLHCDHAVFGVLSISSAEAWRPKQQLPVGLGRHCQMVPVTPWQTY